MVSKCGMSAVRSQRTVSFVSLFSPSQALTLLPM